MAKLARTKFGALVVVSILVLLAAACAAPAEPGAPDTTEAGETAGELVESAAESAAEAEHEEGEEAHEEGEEHHDEGEEHHDEHDEAEEMRVLAVPELAPVALDGRPLRVVATTSIMGDVVSQVGGDQIELTTLMGPGVDPHSYQPAAGDLTAVAEADLILVNGWGLEEGLVDDLADIGGNVPVVPISAGLTPLAFGEGAGHGDEHDEEGEHHEGEEGEEAHEEHAHGAEDPHVWFDVANVRVWSQTLASVFGALDPDSAATYQANADAYAAELDALDAELREQLATIPAEGRVLVTNHDAFGYLAAAYGFEVLGTIIPSGSTLAEPTASDLGELIELMEKEGVCTIFTETTVSDRLGQTVAGELDGCDNVQVLKLFTGALGPAGGESGTYIDFMRANIATLVAGLGEG